MRNPAWLAAALVVAALAITSCSKGSAAGAGGAYGNYPTGTSASASDPAGTMAQSGALLTESTSAGTVLASSQGMTLYYYSADTPHSGKSSCSGSCASAWPPLTGTVQPPSGVTLPGSIGSITRSGGVHQVTINGYPAYTYAGDKSPGEVTGNGMGGEWHVFKVGGKAKTKGGMMKVEVTSAGKVLANPHGMTVYYYTGDKPGSGVSACTGTCAAAWPPVAAPVRVPAGLMLPGPLSAIVRPGGVRQLTINGYPIYRYAEDKAPGQAKGNGAGGEWHVIKLLSVAGTESVRMIVAISRLCAARCHNHLPELAHNGLRSLLWATLSA
jgi:predicted lipoprotein with Yx(FWY)xxD motif